MSYLDRLRNFQNAPGEAVSKVPKPERNDTLDTLDTALTGHFQKFDGGSAAVTEAREERAAIMQYDGRLSRVRAEQLAELGACYYAHHWSCPTCRNGTVTGAAVHRTCPEGAELWRRYDEACRREVGRA